MRDASDPAATPAPGASAEQPLPDKTDDELPGGRPTGDGRVSINDLIRTYQGDRSRYRSLLARYEADHKCEVREEYFADFIFAGALRVYDTVNRIHGIRLAYNSALAEPRFAEVLRRLHSSSALRAAR